jgi:hypothetical protein
LTVYSKADLIMKGRGLLLLDSNSIDGRVVDFVIFLSECGLHYSYVQL